MPRQETVSARARPAHAFGPAQRAKAAEPARERAQAPGRAQRPVIQLKAAAKIYKMGKVEVPALRGVDLSVYPGEFVAIMGPSGSGKSTLMNLVGALDVPTSGQVFLEDQDIATLSESDLAEVRGRKIGFVFQKFNLITSLSALENVVLPTMFQGTPVQARAARAKMFLEKVGLGHRLNHKPTEMSGGEQQRVAIARALVVQPEVVLADEPTGNLDSASGREILALLEDLHIKEKKTIVMVTHDSHVAEFAERIIMISDGRVVGERKGVRHRD